MATAERIIPLPSVPVVDIRSGLMDPNWYDYFLRNAQLVQAFQSSIAAGLRGFIGGLNMSLAAAQDVTVAVGGATDSTATKQIVLASAITKQLANVWAAGTGAGGRLSTDALADGTWNVHLILNSATGAVDVLFALSTAPTPLPTGYDYYRRIGAVLRSGGVIRPFTQDNNVFWLTTSVENYDTNLPITRTLITMTCPPNATVMCRVGGFDAAIWSVTLATPGETDAAPAFQVVPGSSLGGNNTRNNGHFTILTNSSSQIAARTTTDTFSSMDVFSVYTIGWIDQRQ
jgi:hypothetical protein